MSLEYYLKIRESKPYLPDRFDPLLESTLEIEQSHTSFGEHYTQ